MSGSTPTQESIERFLAGERIAVVGVSRNSTAFANAVYRELRDRSYTVHGVNPHADQVEGDPCFASLAEVPDVDGVLVMVPAEASAQVVAEAADAGIARVWLHRGSGPGAVSDEALAEARRRGLDVVPGACPLMFLEGTGLIHRLHRAISGRKVLARI